jgi:hypothetical protein
VKSLEDEDVYGTEVVVEDVADGEELHVVSEALV